MRVTLIVLILAWSVPGAVADDPMDCTTLPQGPLRSTCELPVDACDHVMGTCPLDIPCEVIVLQPLPWVRPECASSLGSDIDLEVEKR